MILVPCAINTGPGTQSTVITINVFTVSKALSLKFL